MANEEECRTALEVIRTRLGDVDADRFAQHVVERTIVCRIPDLGLALRSRIHAGGLEPFEPTDDPRAGQVQVTVGSDDLVALANDELHAARAWATGRLKIEAGVRDLLRLRRLL
ncbi:SCP2 sterol-binding domain-containing protein [Thermomonospora umbrina]|uniref:SCP-2 sterol transfer family protein n=1 Tax=Thermomonospora umbrina TaxID=111806 RepID=A0A3D9T2W6_9ACTN|nr:SCP2 sterol-binding domain-containing protein [Thermomonospora umbrina]REF01191.1 SCP-2 sterol transfer family protein [Thermomonospora umbrina]